MNKRLKCEETPKRMVALGGRILLTELPCIDSPRARHRPGVFHVITLPGKPAAIELMIEAKVAPTHRLLRF